MQKYAGSKLRDPAFIVVFKQCFVTVCYVVEKLFESRSGGGVHLCAVSLLVVNPVVGSSLNARDYKYSRRST